MQLSGHDGPLDPIERARLLERTHEAVFSGTPAPHEPRPVVYDSWQRSLAANVDPERPAPPLVYDSDELDDVRDAHPLAGCLPLLRRSLLEATDEATHVMILTDADGHILWREGNSRVRRAADNVLLAEGTRWSETAIGTNAMGTALATGAPVQIHSAEHLVRTYHEWTCAASPVHDPDTGRVLGAIDLSGPLHTMHPALLALVCTTSTLVEKHLSQVVAERDEALRARQAHHLAALRGEPGALLNRSGRVIATASAGVTLPDRVDLDEAEPSQLTADGRQLVVEPLDEGYLLRARTPSTPATRAQLRLMSEHPAVSVGGREFSLTQRHAEILALLALWPDGLTGEQLALHLHGEKGNPATVRVEMHRLRAQWGSLLAAGTPYRLAAGVDVDFHTVRAAVRRGELVTAVTHHRSGLLPRSESPTLRGERAELLTALRRAVLDGGDVDALWEFGASEPGREDVEVWERLLAELADSDARRSSVLAHLQRLHDEDDE